MMCDAVSFWFVTGRGSRRKCCCVLKLALWLVTFKGVDTANVDMFYS